MAERPSGWARLLTAAGPALLILVAIGLSGCWDRRELESMAFVTALAIDKAGGQFKVTVLVAVPGALAGSGGGSGSSGRSGGGGGAGGPVLALTSTARSLAEAVDRIDDKLSRRVTFLQTRIVVFGEAVARDGVARHFDLLTRYREFTRTFLVAVAEGEAERFFQLQPVIEKDPVRFAISLIEEAAKWGGPPAVRVNEFLIRSESFGGEAVMPLLKRAEETAQEHVHAPGGAESPGSKATEKGGSGSSAKTDGSGLSSPGQVCGTAVFRGDRMVEKLDINETMYYLIGSGRLQAVVHVVPAPGEPGRWVSVILRKGAVKTRAEWRDGKPVIRLNLGLHGDLFGTQARPSPISPRYQEALMKELERDVTLGVQGVVKKTQREKADIFLWGDHYRVKCATWAEFVALDWRNKYPSATVTITASVSIPRGGATLEPPPTH